MKKLANYGSGPDIFKSNEEETWHNFDHVWQQDQVANPYYAVWDMLIPRTGSEEYFDGGVLNHVLCTMNPKDVQTVLKNILKTLKPGAKLIVIDMDILKVFKSYQQGRLEDIPIEEGDLDDRLCFALSGYGTRLSLYTQNRMRTVLQEAGFSEIRRLDNSEYDTRPKESLIFEATK